MLNGKPIVILDSDDVLGRCIKKMADEVHSLIGLQYSEEDILTWDFFETVKHPEHADLKKKVETAMRSEDWCRNIEPFEGAVEGVKRLGEIAEIFVCTSPFGGPFWEFERREWLYKHFKIPGKRVMQGFSKFLMHAEFFVDDKPKNVEEWADYNTKHALVPGVGLLWDRPHNRSVIMDRVRSWGELYYRAMARE